MTARALQGWRFNIGIAASILICGLVLSDRAKAGHNQSERGGATATAPAEGDEEDGHKGEAADGTTAGSECHADPVDMVTGEFFLTGGGHLTPDLKIPVQGHVLDFTRTYRSQFSQNGPLGYGWDFRMRRRLRQRRDGSIVISSGNCREGHYVHDGSIWITPPGVAAILAADPNQTGGYIQTFADGRTHKFDPKGLLVEMSDRHGNTVALGWSTNKEPIYGEPRFNIAPGGSAPYDDFLALVAKDYRLETVTDPLSRVINLAYNADSGRLETITDWYSPTARVWTYGYNDLGNLVSVQAPPTTNPAGTSKTTYKYEDPGDPHNLTQIQAPEQQGTSIYHLTQNYDANGKVTDQTYADGSSNSIVYDPATSKTTLTDANSTTWEYTYDGVNHQILSETVITRGVRNGETSGTTYTTAYQYDGLGRRTRMTHPDSNYTVYEYPAETASALVRDNLLSITHYPILGSGESPLTIVFTYHESKFNQLWTITDPALKVTTYYYDTDDDLERIEFPSVPEGAPIAYFTWKTEGQLQQFEDPNENKTRFGYDTNGYLSSITSGYSTSDAATTTYLPDSLGRTKEITDANGQKTTLAWTDWNLLESVTAPGPEYVISYEYDKNRNLTKIDRKDGASATLQTTQYQYLNHDRLWKVIDHLGHTVEFGYDGNRNRTTVKDAESHVTTTLYDERDLPYTVTDAASRVTTFNYHPNKQLAEIVDGATGSTLYDYDDLDRLETIEHEAAGSHSATTETLNYDANSRLDSVITRAGDTIDYTFDALGRLQVRGASSFDYDLGGRLKKASHTVSGFTATVEYGYNTRDQRTSESITALTSFPVALPITINEQHDGVGNLTLLTHPNDDALTYVPDVVNRLEYIRDAAPTDLITQIHSPLNLLTDRTFETGANVHINYNGAGWVDSITHKDDVDAVIQSLDYSFQAGETPDRDKTGAVTRIIDSLAGAILFDYDLTYQLSKATYPAGYPIETTDFESGTGYDGAGNRRSVKIGTDNAIAYVPNALNQYGTINGTTQTYDANGNLKTDGYYTYYWDTESRLTEVRDAADVVVLATYGYDAFGRRVRSTNGVTGDDTWYLWRGNRLLEEYDTDGFLERRYIYADGYAPAMMQVKTGPSTGDYYVHADHLDTPRLLTDASGDVVWRADYWEFGGAEVDEDPDGNSTFVTFNIRFPGQYYDDETKLHYNRFRYYDPSIGRYISADPIGQLYGFSLPIMQPALPFTEEFEIDTTRINHPYNYVDNSPLSWIDPYGWAKGKNKKGKALRKNPNKRKGSENRGKTGQRERNVGHPDSQEDSRVHKGTGGRGVPSRPPVRHQSLVEYLGQQAAQFCSQNPNTCAAVGAAVATAGTVAATCGSAVAAVFGAGS